VTWLRDVLLYAWGVSACIACVAGIIYICWWASARRGWRALERSGVARTRFEAIWGIILALPLGLGLVVGAASLAAAPSATAPRAAQLTGAVALVSVTVAFFAIPVVALRGRRVPPAVRWVPTGVAFSIGTPLAVLAVFSVPFAVPWYVAGCMVAVRFARAVGQRDTQLRQLPQAGTLAASPAGFVWPT